MNDALPQWDYGQTGDVVKLGPTVVLAKSTVEAGCFFCGLPFDQTEPLSLIGVSSIAHTRCFYGTDVVTSTAPAARSDEP